MDSPKYVLNATDAWKIVRGALVTALGAFITYVSQIYLNVDYSATIYGHVVNFAPLAIVVIGALIETGRRFVAGYSQQ